MAKEYPFPIPEAIQKEADEVIGRLGPHPGSYLCYPPDANPLCLNVFDSCLLELSVIYDAIDLAADKLSGKVGCECEKETSLLYTVTNSLEAELDRMEQLLKWGTLTWKYDPAIRREFEKGPDVPPITEDSNAEPAQDGGIS